MLPPAKTLLTLALLALATPDQTTHAADITPIPPDKLHPGMTDAQLLDAVQRTTFRYFWDYAQPDSGLARERWRPKPWPNITTGGSGFGLMATLVATERAWITRDDALARMEQILTFLANADRFKGAWPHWIDGRTGKTNRFSPKDDGADLVETSFLVAGLLTVRQYFSAQTPRETTLRNTITTLCDAVRWSEFVSDDNRLRWHWSPNYGWDKKLAIGGYNEALITYVLALGATTHPIKPDTLETGWYGRRYLRQQEFYGYPLKIGPRDGGPLFFAHYSFLGLDPRQLEDRFVNYWRHNTAQTLSNRAYCLEGAPPDYHYSQRAWGITASSGPDRYFAHSPDKDIGAIAPTAAISSIPYTPYFSMQALRGFCFDPIHRGRLWSDLGLRDAFSLQRDWYADTTLSIDQGPIIVMIENYRTGLIWKLLMQAPEIVRGLELGNLRKRGGDSGFVFAVPEAKTKTVSLMRHPDTGNYTIDLWIAKEGQPTRVDLLNEDMTHFRTLVDTPTRRAGVFTFSLDGKFPPATYHLRYQTEGKTIQTLRIRLEP